MEAFDFKYMPALVNRIKNLWSSPDAEENFRLIYAESVIRQDMHANNLQFQLTENNQLMAIACASIKNEKNSAGEWWQEQYKKLTPQQQISFNMCRDYLSMMDKKAYALMTEKDIKLDMFISVQKGWGKKLLEKAIAHYKKSGFENLFLWTDCECNVDWYFYNNYELVNQDVYEPFSHGDDEYKTYIFKKSLNN